MSVVAKMYYRGVNSAFINIYNLTFFPFFFFALLISPVQQWWIKEEKNHISGKTYGGLQPDCLKAPFSSSHNLELGASLKLNGTGGSGQILHQDHCQL